MFNPLITSGCISNDCKYSVFVPIQGEYSPNEFRPISSLPHISRVLERFFHSLIFEHITTLQIVMGLSTWEIHCVCFTLCNIIGFEQQLEQAHKLVSKRGGYILAKVELGLMSQLRIAPSVTLSIKHEAIIPVTGN